MATSSDTLTFLLLVFGWVNRKQQKIIDYLLETAPERCKIGLVWPPPRLEMRSSGAV